MDAVPDNVQLVVQHEQISRRPAARFRRLGLRHEQLVGVHIEEIAEHAVHGQEASRHTA
jgi:hypothetical protein